MDRDEIIREIESAFAGVTLGDGIGVFEAWAIDRNASDKELKKARERDCRNDWKEISESDLEEHYSALCFMDDDGVRFSLPAYMRFALRNYDKSQSLSVDAAIHALERGLVPAVNGLTIFTASQQAAIARFLRFMVVDVGDDWVDADTASAAYELFWGQYDNAA
jgi:hypothetical protein